MLRLDNSGYDQNMTFLQYLSFLGIDRYIRPTHIVIHGNVLPRGVWWRRTTNEVANIFFVNVINVPKQIYGTDLSFIEHKADILRYRILYSTADCRIFMPASVVCASVCLRRCAMQ